MIRSIVVAALFVVASCHHSEISAPGDPGDAQLVTTDIENFWRAYDAGGTSAAFQAEYLDHASSGLREFISKRSLTAASLGQMVHAYPRYFAAVRGNMLGLATNAIVRQRFADGNSRLAELYPAAIFRPVTLLVGRFSTGGTTGNSALLIGSEFYSIDTSTPLDELGAFQQGNVHAADSLEFVIAHESIHIQQAAAGSIRGSAGTLLEQAITEGSADFLGELVSNGIINGKIYAWALPRESALWADFKNDMNGQDVSRWLYNQDTATADRPGDLGYFIGYRISKAYYDAAPDKAAAIRDIIQVKDGATKFLARSGYNSQ
jgi:hypothetical protein